MASAIALLAREAGCQVTLLTPAETPAGWSRFTEEHQPTMQALIAADVEIITARAVTGFEAGELQLECAYSGKPSSLQADQFIPVTARIADDALWQMLEIGSLKLGKRCKTLCI